VRPAREIEGIEILTPDDPRCYSAITSFRRVGKTSHADNVALAKLLLDSHDIFTVHRDGLGSGSCVRVTPALATSMADVDRLTEALRDISRRLRT
jgi:selenocysteine lyase/cysteine desulfurase